MAMLFVLYKMFWVKEQPKTIFVGMLLFWLTITIKVFYADFTGLVYENLSESYRIVDTTFISLVGLLVYAVGLYVTSRNATKGVYISFTDTCNYQLDKVFVFYIIITAVSLVLKGILFLIPALSQLINAILQVKMGLMFLLIHPFYASKEKLWLVGIIIGAEVLLSFVSFFSSFKDILITTAIVISFYPIKLSFRQYFTNAGLFVLVIYTMLIWQTIKGEYRFYLNQGTSTQTIQVSASDALNKIFELAKDADPFSKDNDVVYQSIDRLSYIEFFSQAMIRVPSEIPYENGKLWRENIAHILLPRIINPNKKAIDDSQMVNAYCIRQVATAEQGASFSLGFMAESYIDFGPYFMFIPIFLVGCLMGWVYKLLIQKSLNFIWGFSFTSALWVYISCNGTPGTKILGWILMYLIAFFLFKRFLMKPIDKYLRGGIDLKGE